LLYIAPAGIEKRRFGREDIMNRIALAAPLDALAASTAFADLPPPAQAVTDQIGFWNRLHRRLCTTRDKLVRQIVFGVVVAVLFVIGGLVQILGMLP
jgi:hypothetical protein